MKPLHLRDLTIEYVDAKGRTSLRSLDRVSRVSRPMDHHADYLHSKSRISINGAANSYEFKFAEVDPFRFSNRMSLFKHDSIIDR